MGVEVVEFDGVMFLVVLRPECLGARAATGATERSGNLRRRHMPFKLVKLRRDILVRNQHSSVMILLGAYNV